MKPNTPDKGTNRETYLDSAAGLLLVYMIVYHCAQWAGIGDEFVRKTIILSFFMPWFYFKAGMFAKVANGKQSAHSSDTITTVARKSSRRLLVSWLVWSAVGSVVYFAILYLTDGVIDTVSVMRYVKSPLLRGSVLGNMPLWFLFGLFAVRVIYAAIHRLRHPYIYVIAISAVSFLMYYSVTPHLSAEAILRVPNYISYVSSGLMFYALGHLLRDFRPSTKLLVVITVVYLAAILAYPSYVFMYQNTVLMGSYVVSQIYALTGIVAINGWMLRIADRPNILSHIGADTMPLYCMHWIVIEVAAAFIPADYAPFAKLSILLAVNAAALPILTRFYSHQSPPRPGARLSK